IKKTTNLSGVETFVFSPENKLRVFPPNSYKFKPKYHIVLDEVQECLLENFWYQYNNKREEKGYMLSILNSLAKYFHLINSMLPISNDTESVQQRPIYVEFEGPKPGIYVTYEEIIAQKMEAKVDEVGMSWKKYTEIDEALNKARAMLGINYYIEPIAKEYIQKSKMAKNKGIMQQNTPINTRGEGSNKPSYKKSSQKEIDSLDEEYLDWKIIEKFESISPEWKKELKNHILNELKEEMQEKFECLKKEFNDKYDFPTVDDAMEDDKNE
ncbi:hypothetical protein PVAP13_2NG242803, partial [Panicum virgatum]